MKFFKRLSTVFAGAASLAVLVFALSGCSAAATAQSKWDKAVEKSAVDTIKIESFTLKAGKISLLYLSSATVSLDRKYKEGKLDFAVGVGYSGLSGLLLGVLPEGPPNSAEKLATVSGSYDRSSDVIEVEAHATYNGVDSNPENRRESANAQTLLSREFSVNNAAAILNFLHDDYDMFSLYKMNKGVKTDKDKNGISGSFYPSADKNYKKVIELLKPLADDMRTQKKGGEQVWSILDGLIGTQNPVDYMLELATFGKVKIEGELKDDKITSLKSSQKISAEIDAATVKSVIDSLPADIKAQMESYESIISDAIKDGLSLEFWLSADSVYTY